MIWAAINANQKAIWFVVPKVEGKKGMDAEEYIKIMRKFQEKLEERDIDPSGIVYQQGTDTYVFNQNHSNPFQIIICTRW